MLWYPCWLSQVTALDRMLFNFIWGGNNVIWSHIFLWLSRISCCCRLFSQADLIILLQLSHLWHSPQKLDIISEAWSSLSINYVKCVRSFTLYNSITLFLEGKEQFPQFHICMLRTKYLQLPGHVAVHFFWYWHIYIVSSDISSISLLVYSDQ